MDLILVGHGLRLQWPGMGLLKTKRIFDSYGPIDLHGKYTMGPSQTGFACVIYVTTPHV